MKDDIIYWARWVSILPGAIVLALLSTFPLHWILYFIFDGKEADFGSIKYFVQLFGGISYKNIEYTLTPLVLASVFVIVGYKIAPYHYFKTAIVLFIIYLIAWAIGVFFSLSNGYHTLNDFIRPFLGLIGASGGLFHAYTQEKELSGK